MHNEPTLGQYSGVVINQNQRPLADSHWMVPTTKHYQEFVLPPSYARGSDATEIVVPPLTGLQVMVGIDADNIDDASIAWTLEVKSFGSPWEILAQGTNVGSHASGDKVWVDLLAEDAIEVNLDALEDRYRYSITTQNVAKVWYSQPNPLALTFTSARLPDGVTAYSPNGSAVSFCFRVLGLVADEGTDFLGNVYRSAVLNATPQNVSVNGDIDKIWMSKPSPSRFAVESLYFDMRRYSPTTYLAGVPEAPQLENEEAVIDRVILDPITPGIYFTVYYTSEGEPGKDAEEWDSKLWKRVPVTYHAQKRDSYVFPEPITAKYVKVEFSHLQARYYSPGDFASPVSYKKHPKWVLDYFLVYTGAENALSQVTPGRVGVIHDALDLAYSYYLDDLGSEPLGPVEADPNFTIERTSGTELDRLDAEVLFKINLSLAPYRNHPSSFAKADYLIGAYSQAAALENPEYPFERAPTLPVRFDDVTVLRNTQVQYEQNMPVMFFYLTARHKYREVTAGFKYNRAYFVGIREIAFTRENYAVAFDNNQYIEPAGDLLNVERNDFVTRDGVMQVQ